MFGKTFFLKCLLISFAIGTLLGLQGSVGKAGAEAAEGLPSEPVSEADFKARLLNTLGGTTQPEPAKPRVATRGITQAKQEPKPVTSSVVLDENLFRFATNSSRPTRESLKQLDILARTITAQELSAYTLIIAGHTDNRGRADYNLKLSKKRADYVKRYVIDHAGIDANRVVAVGKGEEEPLDSRNLPEAWRKNRRVEFKLVPQAQVQIVYRKKGEYLDRELRAGETLETGDQIAFRLVFHNDFYVYIFSKDTTGQVAVVFPDREDDSDQNQLKQGQEFRVPQEREKWFLLDSNVGTENFYVVASFNSLNQEELSREICNFFAGADSLAQPLQTARTRSIVGTQRTERVVNAERHKRFQERYDYFKVLSFSHE